MKLAAITHADVVRWAAKLAERVGPPTVIKALDVLSQALTLAIHDGRLARNPVDGVPRPRRARGRQRFLTHAEIEKLAHACPEPYGLVVTFLAYTGLRFGEMAALRVRDVDVDRRRVHVATNVVEVAGRQVRQTPKSHRDRRVPYPRFLAPELAELVKDRDDDAPLFASPEGAILRNNNFRCRIFDPAVQAAGLAPLTPHDLRDTAASLAVASGASVKAVQRMLGHASAAMTLDVYAGLFDDELDDVADRMHRASGRNDENEPNADSVRTEDPSDGQQDGPDHDDQGRDLR